MPSKISSDDKDPLINPSGVDSSRLVLFPIKYHDIWDMYKKAEGNFWTADEAKLAEDMKHWENTLNDNERHYIKHVLAFFASADSIVNENLALRMIPEVQYPEARMFYGFQIMMENIHCVSFDTKIYTDKGYIEIGRQVGRNMNVWNGHEWSSVTIRKTSDEAPLTCVKLSNGMELRCTQEHKWFLQGSEGTKTDNEYTFTKDLKIGDVLRSWQYPTLPDGENSPSMENAFTFGFVYGQRHRKGSLIVTLDHLRVIDFLNVEKSDGRLYCYVPKRYYGSSKFTPYNCNTASRVDWLSGVWQSCGKVEKTNEGTRWVFRISDSECARDLQLLLSTFGVFSKCQARDLSISAFTAQKLLDAGVIIDPPSAEEDVDVTIDSDAVVSISSLSADGSGKTYCFNEPKRHAGVFGGILTGQSESYSKMIESYIKDEHEQKYLFESLENIPVIRRKADWALKWIDDENATFGERLLAFACVEGIFFSGSFASIYWLKSRGLMPGLCWLNDKIAGDEGLHCEFACLLYRDHLSKGQVSHERVYEIVREACELEKEFQTEALPCTLIGLNKLEMLTYIEFVTDYLLSMLGVPKIYNVHNPFPFVETINLVATTNFFERVNSNYNTLQGTREFTTDEDF